MRTTKAVSSSTKKQPKKMKHLAQWNLTTHKERPLCDGAAEATTMGMDAGTAPTTNKTFFVGRVSNWFSTVLTMSGNIEAPFVQ